MTPETANDFTDLPDLASEALGGAALACNDEFFAEKENLLRVHAAEWKEHAYTDRGKWMDGWESRRRREPGYDWCVVRLGLPGIIRGIIVDTAFFRGNYPEACSIEACAIDDPLDVAALAHARWTEILPRKVLAGDSKNRFVIACGERFTHVRLNIFPDGGVARLRVHGEVVPDWARLRGLGGPIDLAALEHGAVVELCSDMFFGSRHNLIKPGPSRSMADGWETRRRRGPGNDWALVRLARPGTIERLEIDTSHFKGNAPGRIVVEGCMHPDGPIDHPVQHQGWRVLLATPVQPHRRHLFDGELRRVGVVSHLRLSVFPDGGVARFRAWGQPVEDVPAGLGRLDALSPDEAATALRRCCSSSLWAAVMAAARPFEDVPAMLRAAERIWWSLDEAAWLEAFAGHPRIGEQAGGAWSSAEQQGVEGAGADVERALHEANLAYQDKHGFVFLICATGRSAAEMLEELRARLPRPREVEVRTAAEEHAKITRLRLHKLLAELGEERAS